MPAQPQRGFTLLEVLVTLLLIAVSCAVVGLVAPASPERQARHEAQRLHSLLQLLREHAVLNFAEYALRIEPHAYAVWQLDEHGQWQACTTFKPHQLPAPLSLRLQLQDADSQLLSPAQASQPAQIHLLSSDESSAYTLLVLVHGKPLLRLASDGIAEPSLSNEDAPPP